ncbi:MAG TPA: putative zinc-binding metallopeptidase [Solirubrobacteraceae bacterium]|nr:putative zinc-binding metallopeptidase [Solirubrobacteraceae bacterium]
MRAFACGRCGQRIFFENTACLRCGAAVGFYAASRELVLCEEHPELHRCANETLAGCNWLTAEGPGGLCRSCALTRTRPRDDDQEGLAAFAVAEAAKRRLVLQLLDLGLAPGPDLRFDLLSSQQGPVLTGHADGVVTIDLAESDDARREARRQQLGEPYRTMLGHFRHEIGHYFEPRVLDATGEREAARALFGDERASYAEALERHYRDGPPVDWAERHVSAYATMHPWEDWAESWAHYLHIRDTLETAGAFGLTVSGPTPALSAQPDPELDPGRPFSDLLADWLPLTYALNQINRSMGRDDLYPFTLAPTVIDKLGFVHCCLQRAVAA